MGRVINWLWSGYDDGEWHDADIFAPLDLSPGTYSPAAEGIVISTEREDD